MINNFIKVNDNARVMIHENDGPELRIIDEKGDYVIYKKLNNEEIDMMIRMLEKMKGETIC